MLREISTGKLGTSSQLIEIPDLSKSRLALSGLILAGSSGTVHDSPTRRQLVRDSELTYGALSYYPTRDTAIGQPKLYTQVELYKDGKVIHQSPPRAVEVPRTSTTPDVEIGGRLQLKGLEPGDYFLRLVVTDSIAPGKPVFVARWMDFSIRK